MTIGSEELAFDSWAGQIGHSVTKGLPPLLRFFEAVLPRGLAAEKDPATSYTLRRNNANNEGLVLIFVEKYYPKFLNL